MYQIGQEVICINNTSLIPNTIPPPLILNKIYAVQDEHTCSCGHKSIDVGIRFKRNIFLSKFRRAVCSKCGIYHKTKIWWCDIRRFALIDYVNAKKVVLKNLVKKHPIIAN